MAEASDFQRDIIEDAVVTQAEHERAVLAYTGCIEDEGVTIVQLEQDEHGQIELLAVGGSEDPADDPSPVVEECKQEFYTLVADGYRVSLDPDGTEDSLIAEIGACLVEKGYDVPDGADEATMMRIVEQESGRITDWGECVSAAQ